jgi:poly(beta-D-mannuronate) C5 epimerase
MTGTGMNKRAKGAYKMAAVATLLTAAIASFVFGRTHPELALEKAPFGRLSYVPSYDPIQDVSLGIPMDSGNDKAAKPDPSIRAILILPTQIILRAGGVLSRVVEQTTPVTTLHDLVGIIADPDWISETGSVITMNAAVVLGTDGQMTISPPLTTEVVMTVRQGVFLAASKAQLTLTGVYVHADNEDTPTAGSATAVRADLGRPFVLAVDNSTMVITDSTFRYLGRDWNSSYGVAWSKGSTGSVNNSIFEKNFIGIYTDHSDGLQILNSKFYHNSLYGVDPHSHSSNLLVAGNTANFNGRHGIIFSDHVTGGIVRDNITNGNGLNGIMMDEESTGNKIENNSVGGNLSDGIVMADSGNNDISGNTVTGNRVGIHVRGATSTDTNVIGNVVSGNKMAAQGIELPGNSVDNNGGEWQVSRIATVWAAALGLLAVLSLLTWTNLHIRQRRQLRGRVGLA